MSRRIGLEYTNEIIKDYRNNILLKDMIIKYNCSRKVIHRILKENNIEIKDRQIGSKYIDKYNIDFEIIDTQEKAYILGLWAADGNTYEVDYTVKLGMSDYDIIEKVRNAICPEKPIRTIKSGFTYFKNSNKLYAQKNHYAVVFNNKKLYMNFIKHGVVPRKSSIIKPPSGLPDNLINHWIRGYFDGDGHITYANKTLVFGISSSSKDLIDFIYNVIYSIFGIKGCIDTSTKSKFTNQICYKIIYNSHNAIRVLKWIYEDATIYMERKWNLAKQYVKNSLPDTTRHFWSEEDKEVLKEKYPNSSKEELLKLFPYTSWCAVMSMASTLKIKRKYNWRKDNEREEQLDVQ